MLIPYDEFAVLRLTQFLSRKVTDTTNDPGAGARFRGKIVSVRNWELFGELWCGEVFEFTSFFRLQSAPDELRCIELDLTDMPAHAAKAIFYALDLPLKTGMSIEAISRTLGKPTRIERDKFVTGQHALTYAIAENGGYTVQCAVRDGEGLFWVVVLRDDAGVKP